MLDLNALFVGVLAFSVFAHLYLIFPYLHFHTPHSVHFSCKNMTSGGSHFNDFPVPQNQLTKVRAVETSIKDLGFF